MNFDESAFRAKYNVCGQWPNQCESNLWRSCHKNHNPPPEPKRVFWLHRQLRQVDKEIAVAQRDLEGMLQRRENVIERIKVHNLLEIEDEIESEKIRKKI